MAQPAETEKKRLHDALIVAQKKYGSQSPQARAVAQDILRLHGYA